MHKCDQKSRKILSEQLKNIWKWVKGLCNSLASLQISARKKMYVIHWNKMTIYATMVFCYDSSEMDYSKNQQWWWIACGWVLTFPMDTANQGVKKSQVGWPSVVSKGLFSLIHYLMLSRQKARPINQGHEKLGKETFPEKVSCLTLTALVLDTRG